MTANCSPLPNITNGAVNLPGGTTFPSVAMYSCDGGYELQGDPVRMCNESGVWNGTEPTCTPAGMVQTSALCMSFSMLVTYVQIGFNKHIMSVSTNEENFF